MPELRRKVSREPYEPDPETEADADTLIFGPEGALGPKYRDAESCGRLIEVLRRRLVDFTCRDDTEIQNVGAEIAAERLLEVARTGKHVGTFGGETMEACAQAILECHRRADRAIVNALRVQRRGEEILKVGMAETEGPVDSAAVRRAALIEAVLWLDGQPYPGEYQAGGMAKHFGLPDPAEMHGDDEEGTDEQHSGR